MTDLQEKAMRMALERLESHEYWMDEDAIQALRQALAQPEQEPVAWVLYYNHENGAPRREIFYGKAYMEETKSYNETHRGLKCQVVPLYTAPPKREWVGLTHEERDEIDQNCRSQMEALFAVEAKLKEKNA